VTAVVKCSLCRKPTTETTSIAGRDVPACATCAPKIARGARAGKALALRGVGLAWEKYAPKSFAVAKTAYTMARDAWSQADEEKTS
jgi:hypothetical protein